MDIARHTTPMGFGLQTPWYWDQPAAEPPPAGSDVVFSAADSAIVTCSPRCRSWSLDRSISALIWSKSFSGGGGSSPASSAVHPRLRISLDSRTLLKSSSLFVAASPMSVRARRTTPSSHRPTTSLQNPRVLSPSACSPCLARCASSSARHVAPGIVPHIEYQLGYTGCFKFIQRIQQ